MTLNAAKYPIAPMSTPTTDKAFGTLAEQLDGFAAIKDEEIEIYDVSELSSTIYTTLIKIGRRANGGQYDTQGLTEHMFSPIEGYKVAHIEKQEPTRKFELNDSGVTTTTTTLVLTSNEGLYPYLVLRNTSTNEHVKIVSVNINGTDIVVTRAFGTVAAANMTTADTLIVLNSSVPA